MNVKMFSMCMSLFAAVSVAESARADCNSSSPCSSQGNAGTGNGLAAINTGSGYSVYAKNTSSGGAAIYGQSTNAGYGVQGWTQGGAGYAGYFGATGNGSTGVYASGLSIGVSGNTTAGVAGYFTAGTGGTAIVGTGGVTAAWLNGDVWGKTYNNISDARRKKDVRDLSYGTNDVLKLRPVTFKWKNGDDTGVHLGLIAQEVQKVVPEVVSSSRDPISGDEVLAVAYSELVPVLIKTIQEQNTRILALEKSRPSVKLSALYDVGGGSLLGLLPLGFVVASRRRKAQSKNPG